MDIQIQLECWKVASLEMKLGHSENEPPKEKSGENSFHLSFEARGIEGLPDEFVIAFDITIEGVELTLDLHMDFFFKANQDLDEEFKKSDFVKVSAPAIAFPYIRSYISNLTLQSGYPTVILPSINFVHLAKEKERKKNLSQE